MVTIKLIILCHIHPNRWGLKELYAQLRWDHTKVWSSKMVHTDQSPMEPIQTSSGRKICQVNSVRPMHFPTTRSPFQMRLKIFVRQKLLINIQEVKSPSSSRYINTLPNLLFTANGVRLLCCCR